MVEFQSVTLKGHSSDLVLQFHKAGRLVRDLREKSLQ